MATRETRTDGQSRCNSCGSFVTPRFARVFGGNDDEVFGCLACQRTRDLREGNQVPTDRKRGDRR
ncbi:hypothetical protein ACFO0N_08215 [Halobium salinum]|uniref:Small CPxCG-related zinc finger protein n=1 Tax=Halobium salinum TaxID=1364940 RepID=A0ABD5PB49_9EURY|nr:hypothetical protein [Halobium salinum]